MSFRFSNSTLIALQLAKLTRSQINIKEIQTFVLLTIGIAM